MKAIYFKLLHLLAPVSNWQHNIERHTKSVSASLSETSTQIQRNTGNAQVKHISAQVNATKTDRLQKLESLDQLKILF